MDFKFNLLSSYKFGYYGIVCCLGQCVATLSLILLDYCLDPEQVFVGSSLDSLLVGHFILQFLHAVVAHQVVGNNKL